LCKSHVSVSTKKICQTKQSSTRPPASGVAKISQWGNFGGGSGVQPPAAKDWGLQALGDFSIKITYYFYANFDQNGYFKTITQ